MEAAPESPSPERCEPLRFADAARLIAVGQQAFTGAGDVCFVEDAPLAPHRARITCLYVFRWNRDYPADRRLDLDLSGWERTEQEEFPGSSHDKITLERYLPPAT